MSAVLPASWLAVDEIMVSFKGRSIHTMKIKNKPINEGFKIWVFNFNSYIYIFCFHFRIEGSEGMIKYIYMEQIEFLSLVQFVPQFQVPIVLCQ
jgi:hypothetical protein